MTTPLITALIDTFNQEKYIAQCLTSVLDQGLSSHELQILVVDDGSTDNTSEIIKNFGPRVQHLRKVNGGQASAFNAAFPEVRGQFVALLDGDDWWDPSKLSKVLAQFHAQPGLSAVGHGHFVARDDNPRSAINVPPHPVLINLDTPGAAHIALQHWRFIPTSALTLRRSTLQRVIPIPEKLVFAADAPICMAAMAAGILIINEPLTFYRQHSQNLFAIDSADSSKLQRKARMDETMYELLYPTLRNLDVPPDSISAFLDYISIDARRFRLANFGGSRRETFQTEMQAFRNFTKNPTLAYRLFKYLVVGASAFTLPPRQFYKFRSWYARREVGKYRERITATSAEPSARPPPESR